PHIQQQARPPKPADTPNSITGPGTQQQFPVRPPPVSAGGPRRPPLDQPNQLNQPNQPNQPNQSNALQQQQSLVSRDGGRPVNESSPILVPNQRPVSPHQRRPSAPVAQSQHPPRQQPPSLPRQQSNLQQQRQQQQQQQQRENISLDTIGIGVEQI